MPSLEDVTNFNQLLVGLADEPEYLERLGVAAGPLKPPVDTTDSMVSWVAGTPLRDTADSATVTEPPDIPEQPSIPGQPSIPEQPDIQIQELDSDLDILDENMFSPAAGPEQAEEQAAVAADIARAESFGGETSDQEQAGPESDTVALSDYFELPEEFRILDETPAAQGKPAAASPTELSTTEISLVDEQDPFAQPLPGVGAPITEGTAEQSFQLSDDELRRLQSNLARLPLNLKMAAEEILAEQTAEHSRLITFINLLLQDSSPSIIARHASRILDKPIHVPDAFRRPSDIEPEQLQPPGRSRSLFRSIITTTAGLLVALLLLLFLSWRFVYRPIRAAVLYERGLDTLNREEYQPANQLFGRAVDLWQSRRRYYQFADAFIDNGQYDLAAEKYEQLLARYRFDRRGLLDYAYLEGTLRADYDKSTRILVEAIDAEAYNYDILAALGDTYLEWGELESERRESARVSYARLLDEYGDRDPSLMRMLHYFIRVDNPAEVEYLTALFENDQNADITPHIYAELGGYLLDRQQIDNIEAILIRALDVDNTIPEAHYHLARYYLDVEDLQAEERALTNTIALLEATEPLSNRHTRILIDAYGRAAEDKYRETEYLTARGYYQQGIEIYEAARARGAFEPQPLYGRLYAGLGDIDYYVARDYASAQRLYTQAERNRYSDRGLDYRQGFILYRSGEYSEALNQFIDASGSFSNNRNLLFAQANALFNLQSYAAAQGYYDEIVDNLNRERATIDQLSIDSNRGHAELIDYLIRAYNNSGVALVQLGERLGNSALVTRGLANLTRSNELAVNFARDPETAARAESINLAYLNSRAVLYPLSGFDLQIFNAIPEDLSASFR